LKIENLDWGAKILRYILVVLGLLFVVIYLAVVVLRIRYPFELEWIEGSGVDHVQRVLDGLKIYVPPSLDFSPFVYTPLYHYISAAVAWVIGIGLLPLRLVSFVASLGSFWVIYRLVKWETKNLYAALLGVGTFAAMFHISGCWYDIARPDMLFTFWALVAVYLLRRNESWWSWILAGICISLSFLTKQSALIIVIPMGLYCIYANWKRAIFFIATAVVIIWGSTLILNKIHDGWYNFYIFEVPREHYILKARYIFFWITDLLGPLPVLCAVILLYLVQKLTNGVKKEGVFYWLMAAGMVGAAWSGRLHSGGYVNVLLPGYAMVAILFGVAFHHLEGFLQSKVSGEAGQSFSVVRVLVYLVCVAQLAGLMYNPKDQIPTKVDLQAGWELVKMMKSYPGEVYLPCHGFIPTYAGKKTHAHVTALHDLLRGDETPIKKKVLEMVNEAIREQRFEAIFLDKDEYIVDLTPYYTNMGRIFSDYQAFWTVTGMEIRPEFLFLPKRSENPPEANKSGKEPRFVK
jgi:4-amino-4-deoxy-L-arabinose transferase-like glycosyltransferase